MTTSESKGRFFTKRIDSHNESNRELECSSWGRSLLLDCDVIGIGGSERNSRKASAAQRSSAQHWGRGLHIKCDYRGLHGEPLGSDQRNMSFLAATLVGWIGGGCLQQGLKVFLFFFWYLYVHDLSMTDRIIQTMWRERLCCRQRHLNTESWSALEHSNSGKKFLIRFSLSNRFFFRLDSAIW